MVGATTCARLPLGALALGLLLLACGALGSSIGTAIFLPMKCSLTHPSGRCGDRRASEEEGTCRDLGCCFSNRTCYHKVSDGRKMVVHYMLLTFFILALIGAFVGCLLYFRKRAREEKKAQQKAAAKRKMDKIYAREFEEHSKRTER